MKQLIRLATELFRLQKLFLGELFPCASRMVICTLHRQKV
jgi:hypothetical protein